jgi:hypothetical protein
MSADRDEKCDTTDEEDETVCVDDATMSDEGECEDSVSDTPLSDEGDLPIADEVGDGAEVLGEVVTNTATAPDNSTAPESSTAPAVEGGGESVMAAGVTAPAERPATMPLTGGDILTLLAAGLGLLLTGLFVLRFRRD